MSEMPEKSARTANWLSGAAIFISILALLGTAFGFFGIPTPGQTKANVSRARTLTNRAWPFFAPMAKASLDSYGEMVGYASPGSPAYKYAHVYYESWLAWTSQTHGAPPAWRLRKLDDRISVCRPRPRHCYTASHFVFDRRTQLLYDYSVDGVPLSGRVVGVQDWQNHGSVWVRLEGAWVSTSNELEAAISIENNGSQSISLRTDCLYYYDYNLQLHQFQNLAGRRVYPAGQRGIVFVTLSRQKLGGYFALGYGQTKVSWLNVDVPSA